MRNVERYIAQARVLDSQKDRSEAGAVIFEGPRCFCQHSVMCAHLPGLSCTVCGASSMWDTTLHQILYNAAAICLFINIVIVSFLPLFYAVSLSQAVLTSELTKPLSELQSAKHCKIFQSKVNCSWKLQCGIVIFHKKNVHLDPYLLKEQFVPDDLLSSK